MNVPLRSVTLLALAAAALAADAQSTVSGGFLSITGRTDYVAQIGSLGKFDPNLGTLTGVALSFGYGLDSTLYVAAVTNATGTVSTSSAAGFSSSDNGVSAVLNALVNTSGAATIGGGTLDPAAFDLTGNVTAYTVGSDGFRQYPSAASASKTVNVPAAQLAAFVATPGSARFDVSGRTLTGPNVAQASGFVRVDQVSTATQTIGVVYAYTANPVPEPSALAALGLGALALVKRRKR